MLGVPDYKKSIMGSQNLVLCTMAPILENGSRFHKVALMLTIRVPIRAERVTISFSQEARGICCRNVQGTSVACTVEAAVFEAWIVKRR